MTPTEILEPAEKTASRTQQVSTGQQAPDSKPEQSPTTQPKQKKLVIGFVCERSVDLGKLTGGSDYLKDDPNVAIIPMPCSGMIRPMGMEKALKQGASKVFAAGCKIGDCHFRNGNMLIRDRLRRLRAPKLKNNTPDAQVGCFFHSKENNEKFLAEVRDFVNAPLPAQGKK